MKQFNFLLFLIFMIMAACTQLEVEPQATIEPQEETEIIIPTPSINPSPSPTTEDEDIKINSNYPDADEYWSSENVRNQYTPIVIEDFLSGKIQEAEKEFLETHPQFSSKTIPTNMLTILNGSIAEKGQYSIKTRSVDIIPTEEYSSDPETRPITEDFFAFYPIVDFDLYKELGIEDAVLKSGMTSEQFHEIKAKVPSLWLVSWQYLNPDGTITTGHTIMSAIRYKSIKESTEEENPGKDFKFMPTFEFNVVENNTNFEDALKSDILIALILETYPELKPDPGLINQWVNSGQMPKELENSLFSTQGTISVW